MKLSLRKKKVRGAGDRDGVMATLLIARRLVKEWDNKALYPALDEALPMAVPKDRARAWWGAHRLLTDEVPGRYSDLSDYLMSSTVTSGDVLNLIDAAIDVASRRRFAGGVK